MSKKEFTRYIWSLVLNFVIFFTEILGIVLTFQSSKIWVQFQYYTLDSNIFLCIASFFMIFANINVLIGKYNEYPEWVKQMKYMSSCVVAVTFLVVIFILSPMMARGMMDGLQSNSLAGSYKLMLTYRSMLWHHFVCPVLGVLSFCLFEGFTEYKVENTFKGLIPTLVYAVPIIILNLFKVIEGPYPFLYVYRQPWFMSIVWFFVVDGTALGIAYLINRFSRRSF